VSPTFLESSTAGHSAVDAVCDDLGTESHIRLSGRITIDSSPALRKLLFKKLESECRIVALDFSEVSYVDTSGLAVLVEALRAARSRSKSLRLTGLRDRPRFLLEAIGLLKLFDETPGNSTS
jgi:anti-sigma B factor antagonist